MGWIISVGKAGAKGSTRDIQALSIFLDVDGQTTRVTIADGLRPGAPAHRVQARRVWQTLLTTLIGDRHIPPPCSARGGKADH
jgi:hypothetical protein